MSWVELGGGGFVCTVANGRDVALGCAFVLDADGTASFWGMRGHIEDSSCTRQLVDETRRLCAAERKCSVSNYEVFLDSSAPAEACEACAGSPTAGQACISEQNDDQRWHHLGQALARQSEVLLHQTTVLKEDRWRTGMECIDENETKLSEFP